MLAVIEMVRIPILWLDLRFHAALRANRTETVPVCLISEQGGKVNPHELKPGALQLEFFGAEDLAAKLVELSQAMANDWPTFSNAVEG